MAIYHRLRCLRCRLPRRRRRTFPSVSVVRFSFPPTESAFFNRKRNSTSHEWLLMYDRFNLERNNVCLSSVNVCRIEYVPYVRSYTKDVRSCDRFSCRCFSCVVVVVSWKRERERERERERSVFFLNSTPKRVFGGKRSSCTAVGLVSRGHASDRSHSYEDHDGHKGKETG